MNPIPPRKTDNRPAAGFTLVELAVVLVIVTLLTTGLMMTLTVQRDVQQLSEVRRQLADIREALIGYAMANGRLPYAAAPGKKSGVDAGVGTSEAALTKGVLPWVTLGLPETDPWGQRFTYQVTGAFADANPSPPQASFSLADSGDITVKDTATTNIATNLPVIVVSHGKNGRGGYRSDGTQVAGAAGDEQENANFDVAAIFVSRTQSPDFDDELTWVSLQILLNRMVSAGRLP